MAADSGRSLIKPLPLILALILAAGASRLAGQDPDAQELPPIFTESVRVNVVNVEVRVTDDQGDPVTDLTLDDFQVFEDGRPVEITNFYVVQNGRRVEPVAGSTSEESSTGTVALLPASAPRDGSAPVAEADQLRLVIYFDNYNVRPIERNRVMDKLARFIRNTVRRDDLAMVASFDRSVSIRQHFTSDTTLIADELAKLEDAPGHKVLRDRERQSVLRTLDDASSSDIAMNAVRNYAETLYNEMGYGIDGLKEIIDFLAGLPGRKALIHVSGGMPMVAAEDLFYAIEQKFDDSRALSYAARYDLSRRFQEVEDRANANNVTFYMLDAGGLRVNTSGTAEYQGLSTAGMSFRLDSDYQSNLQSPLRYLADETGGQAIVNQNDILPGLAKIASDLRTFYSLGFLPAHGGDGRYHDIDVKVKRKGVQLRHRSGYRDKSPEKQMIEGTMAALLHSYQKNPLDVELAFGAEKEQEDGTFLVPIQVRVPIAQIALLPDGEAHQARMRFFVAVMDERGGISAVQQVPVGIKLRDEHVDAARTESYIHQQELLMRGGLHKVALGVSDELSGQASFLAQSRIIGR